MSSEAVAPPAFATRCRRGWKRRCSRGAAIEPKQLDRYAPDAMLQTGPGTPDWQFLTYRLNWSGPVDPAQTRAPHDPVAVLVVAVARAGHRVERTARACSDSTVPTARRRTGLCQTRAVVRQSLRRALLAALVCLAPSSHAQTPDAQVLGELKRRLSEPARCAPNCAEIVVAGIDVNDDRLAIDLDVHAQANVALGMPHAGSAWIIERVLVDASRRRMRSRGAAMQLELPLTPGVHRISMVGRIAAADELSVEFPAPPRRIVVRAQGWDSSGSSEGRLLNNALQLTRRIGANASSATLTPQRLPAFVRIHRRVFMNLDWTVTTQVERLAPEEGAFTLRLPLLPGEAVLTPGFEVRDGYVLASMPAGENSRNVGIIARARGPVAMGAATEQPWVEQWDVIVSPTWHAEFSGTPAILPSEYRRGLWINQFLPRPGESARHCDRASGGERGDHAGRRSGRRPRRALVERLTNTMLNSAIAAVAAGDTRSASRRMRAFRALTSMVNPAAATG